MEMARIFVLAGLLVCHAVTVCTADAPAGGINLVASPASACLHERVRVAATATAAACGGSTRGRGSGGGGGCTVRVTAAFERGGGVLFLGAIELPAAASIAAAVEMRLRPVVGCALDEGLCAVALTAITAAEGAREGGGAVIVRFSEATTRPGAATPDAIGAFLRFEGPWPAILGGAHCVHVCTT
jgi:hypothetical protein